MKNSSQSEPGAEVEAIDKTETGPGIGELEEGMLGDDKEKESAEEEEDEKDANVEEEDDEVVAAAGWEVLVEADYNIFS